MSSKIIDIRHPYWRERSGLWRKWRLVYEGGECFVNSYTKKFSERETNASYRERLCITPSPSFAKSAVNDVKNSIFQRLTEIVRRGGTDSYVRAVMGQDNGVDLHGSSMNTYIGREVLPELLSMGRVGIYVDAPPLVGPTLLDQQKSHPYLYAYRVEDILSWSYRKDKVDEYQSVLLQDWVDDCDLETGLPMDQWCRYRHVWLDANGKVNIQFYDDDCNAVDMEGNVTGYNPIILNIERIPFTLSVISESLLADAANHQIALLNMESSDVSYLLKSGFPFYTEQQDDAQFSSYLAQISQDGTASGKDLNKTREISVGPTQGRIYGKGLDRPEFINPSSEPIVASMQKQDRLKADIRALINLAVANIQPKMASAESKSFDERGLEAGLSYIGLELEHMERKVAEFWQMYEGASADITIKYPQKYSLQTDADRRQDVEQLEKLRDSIPSPDFQKSISKQMITILLSGKITVEEMDKMYKEIDNAKCFTANPDIIFAAIEHGVMSLEIAAQLLGLPPDSVAQAAKDHADRAARVAMAQSDPAARGVPDLSANPASAGSAEKTASVDTTLNTDTQNPQRGKGQ